MFGAKWFILKAALIWIFISVVLVESARHKKDVHHMIFLNEETTPSKSHRHKHHSHSSRSKRRPSKKSKPKPTTSSYSSEESSFEIAEEDEDSIESFHSYSKPKSKRPSYHHKTSKRHHKHHSNHKKNHKSDHHRDNKRHHDSEHQAPHGSWVPMASKELFGYQPPSAAFSGAFPHYPYHQTVPMEITTPFSVPNTLINFGNTMYPPLESNNQFSPQMNPMIGAVEAYKPFDYSVLEQNNAKPTQTHVEQSTPGKTGVDQHAAASTGFSIVVDEHKDERNEEMKIGDGNMKKGRGNGRHRIKKTQ